jgi:hypothetical protein
MFIRILCAVNRYNGMSSLWFGVPAISIISLHGFEWKKAILPHSMAAMSTLSRICSLPEEIKRTIRFNFASG